MSIQATAHSEQVARDLEKVLKKGIQIGEEEIIFFLKKEIYPLYQIHLREANYQEDEKVREHYK